MAMSRPFAARWRPLSEPRHRRTAPEVPTSLARAGWTVCSLSMPSDCWDTIWNHANGVHDAATTNGTLSHIARRRTWWLARLMSLSICHLASVSGTVSTTPKMLRRRYIRWLGHQRQLERCRVGTKTPLRWHTFTADGRDDADQHAPLHGPLGSLPHGALGALFRRS